MRPLFGGALWKVGRRGVEKWAVRGIWLGGGHARATLVKRYQYAAALSVRSEPKLDSQLLL